MLKTQTVSEKALLWETRHVPRAPAIEIPDDGLAVSEDEYWKYYYNHLEFTYEWNNGYLEAKPMADLKGSRIYQWFFKILSCYFSTYQTGEIINLEIGFRLALPGKTTIRIPDMAVVLDDNPVMINEDDCSFSGTFDMCIESLSYSSSKEVRRDTIIKRDEYEGIGVREYYILDARGIKTEFYTRNKRGKYAKISSESGDIVQSAVLPGFQFRISDLYRQPLLEELSEDEVYYKYVFPSFKLVKQRAEQAEKLLAREKKKTERESQRAEQERKRAEHLEAKLEALGISLE